MITYTDDTLARFAAGEIDELLAIEFYFDSGNLAFCPGIVGSFTYGGLTYIGAHGLLTVDAPDATTGNDSQPITVTMAETYVPPDSDVPVNIFDDGVRATIDDEPWQGRVAIFAAFYLDASGNILEREQLDVMQIDGMTEQQDQTGRPVRVATLERPDIIQRDIEGKTMDPAFQALIDSGDTGMAQAATTVTQEIGFGQIPTQTAGS